jgi:hypothetical protein
MCVPNSYFSGKGHFKQTAWLTMWREAMRNESIMKFDFHIVKKSARHLDQ